MRRPDNRRRVLGACLGAVLAVVVGVGVAGNLAQRDACSFAESREAVFDRQDGTDGQASAEPSASADEPVPSESAAPPSDEQQAAVPGEATSESATGQEDAEATGSSNEASPGEAATVGGSSAAAAMAASEDRPAAGTPAAYAYSAAADEAAAEAVEDEELPRHEGQAVLISIAEGTTREELDAMLEGLDFATAEDVSDEDLAYGLVKLQLAEDMPVAEACARLEFLEGVKHAQPNYLYTLAEDIGNPVAFAVMLDDTMAVEMAAEAVEDAAAEVAGDEAAASQAEAEAQASAEAGAEGEAQAGAEAEAQAGAEAETSAASIASSDATAQTAEGSSLAQDLAAASFSINDPKASSQWALASVHAYEAWVLSRCEGNVGIAIIDTGADLDHEDLVANIKGSSHFEGSSDEDEYGHGTHVTGIAGATTNNELGIAGVSYNADVYSLRASYDEGAVVDGQTKHHNDFSTQAVADALQWVLNNAESKNIRVINMSLGGAYSGTTLSDNDAILSRIKAAYDAGILPVCAACNKSPDAEPYACYPGDYQYALSVINLEQSTSSTAGVVRASTSNYNVSSTEIVKDISAPGTSITSTYLNGVYTSMGGTSMASPLVAGIAALLYKATPNLTAAGAMSALTTTATDLGDAQQYGHGEVNAYQALLSQGIAGIDGSQLVQKGRTESYTVLADEGLGTWTTWSSSDENVATIDSSGTLTAVATGTTTLTATSSTGKTATLDVEVIDPSISGDATVFARASASDETIYSYAVEGGSTCSWTFSSSDESVVTVYNADTGKVYAPARTTPATCTVTATCDSNPNITATLEVTVLPAMEIVGTAELCVGEGADYSLSPVVDGVDVVWSVSAGAGYVSLAQGVDTQLGSYAHLTAAQAGGSVTLVASCSVGDSSPATLSYAVATTQADITGSSFSYGTIASQTYTGSSLTPAPTVTYNGTALTKDTDYTLSYANNVDVGTATVTVSGTGNYTGEKSMEFAITARSISDSGVSASLSATAYTWDGASHQSTPTLTYGGKELAAGTDYTVSYSSDTISPGQKTVTITGVGNFTGSRTLTYTINKRSMASASISISPTAYTYTGASCTPTVTVKYGGTTVDRSNYSVSYSNNVNAGTATVTVTGVGSYYTGKQAVSYTISKRNLSGAVITLSQTTYTYTGSACKPTVTVTYAGSTVASSNYDVSYSNNVSVGTATVTVTGKGTNYMGSRSTTFTIRAASNSGSGSGSESGTTSSVSRITMYRLYNPNSGEHFYTASAEERDAIVAAGWTYEGVGWTAPSTSNTPVYRLYSGTDHHYTTNASERDYLVSVGWVDEGIGWYSDDAQGTPLYRQYNPNVNPKAARNNSGSHNYTTSKGENDYLASIGWIAEGIGWYGL